MNLKNAFALAACCIAGAAAAEGNLISVDVADVKCKSSPDLWGIFVEEIGGAVTGGLHAELISNPSFEYVVPKVEIRLARTMPQDWKLVGDADARCDESLPVSTNNRWCVRVDARPGGGIANYGNGGLSVKKGTKYTLSMSVRGETRGTISYSVERYGGTALAGGTISVADGGWQRKVVEFAAKDSASDCRLALRADDGGVFYLDNVSLLPGDACGKGGIFRSDLVDRLKAMKPSVLRFPGGCWVEGDWMRDAYRWKRTLGPVEERHVQWCRWEYWATHGIGFHEYLLLCEELGAKPIFCVNAGMSHNDNVPMDKMDEFVQDAVDAIEYCNGPADSKWGSLRARAGHPEPFNLQYIEIGNENSGKEYDERYALFYDAIRAKHPGVKIVADRQAGWDVKSRPFDLRDDHFFMTPDWFMSVGSRHYDDVEDRDAFGIYVGEYSARDEGEPAKHYGTLRGAIAEAAFMVGLERNSDLVKFSSQAPLLARLDAVRWMPNNIYFTGDRSFVTPSYDVQRIFSDNRLDSVLKCSVVSETTPIKADAKRKVPDRTDALVANAGIAAGGKTLVVKVVNCAEKPVSATLSLKNARLRGGLVRTVFPVEDGLGRDDCNTHCRTVATSATFHEGVGRDAEKISLSFKPLSLTVLRIGLSNP